MLELFGSDLLETEFGSEYPDCEYPDVYCSVGDCSVDIPDADWNDNHFMDGVFSQDSFDSSVQIRKKVSAQQQPTTTLMIRNIPRLVSQDELMNEINRAGFESKYNFFYLPCDFKTGLANGYAFINLISPTIAGSFVCEFHRSRRFSYENLPLNIARADIQGFDALKKKWGARSQRIRNPNLRPYIQQPSTLEAKRLQSPSSYVNASHP